MVCGTTEREMQIGYARTSTTEQVAGLEAQLRDLKAAGCTKVFSEQTSSVSKRDQLEAAIDYLRDGDVLVVTKLDRLARSMRDLLNIVDRIEGRGAGLRILAMNLDTTTATGRLLLQMVGSIAEFERAIMLERQREGVAKAKAAGKYRGRAKTAKAKSGEVEAMLSAGEAPTEVAKKLGIGRSSVYRIIADLDLRRKMAARECSQKS
jgi:DNA invertase Pin-like site-specific DNA recombinase